MNGEFKGDTLRARKEAVLEVYPDAVCERGGIRNGGRDKRNPYWWYVYANPADQARGYKLGLGGSVYGAWGNAAGLIQSCRARGYGRTPCVRLPFA